VETRGRNPVVIVGGGLSGLAAAVHLAGAGIPVHLLEQRATLGGRARSYVDATTGVEVDNGQHLLIAGYAQTLAFLERMGTRHLVDVQPAPALPFHHPERGFVELRVPLLPSPMHLACGILRTGLLSPAHRLSLLRGGVALWLGSAAKTDELTIAEWLDRHHQPAEVRRCFWDPLAVAIMNETPDRASARLFCDALRQAFLRHPQDAALVFPRAGLSCLFAEPAAAFITQHGGRVQCGADVNRFTIRDGAVTEAVLKDGTVIPCAVAILAVPPMHARDLVSDAVVPGLSGFASGPVSPIIGIHLWMNTAFMPGEAVGVIGKRIQWVFRHERHVSLVISAAHEFVGMGNNELVTLAMEDLRSVFGSEVGGPDHAVVIREKQATFSATPENNRKRPGPDTGIRNLFLAGDWTATGLPATIEGAILSGNRAAARAAVHCV
jgi:hydroxysqualene dehydroxylase